MEALFFRVAAASAAVSVVLLALLSWPRWRKRYSPHTRRAVWLVIAAVLLAAPLLPKSRAPLQITVPERAVTVPAAPPQANVPAAPVMPQAPVPSVDAANPAPAEPPAARTVNGSTLLACLWLAGGLAVLLWQGTAYLLARRKVMRNAVPCTGWEELAVQLCPGRPVRFFRVNGLGTPMTLGALRPVVLLPQGEVRQAAVRHELIHIRRWDVAWKHLLLLACAVHWFNPLVWLMSRRADRDMEASCDALVVAGAGAAERRAYGELLLRTAAGQSVPLTTRFGGGKGGMKARLYDLFHPGKKSRVLVGAVLLLCLLSGSLVACRSAEAPEPEGTDAVTGLAPSHQDGPVADGVYCAPMPDFVETDGEIDQERWSFVLTEYDPETGTRGAALGTFVLPLAEDLTLQALWADFPIAADAVGTQTRVRRVLSFMTWPSLRSSINPPGVTDLLEVRVRDGAVTGLKWFLLDSNPMGISAPDGLPDDGLGMDEPGGAAEGNGTTIAPDILGEAADYESALSDAMAAPAEGTVRTVSQRLEAVPCTVLECMTTGLPHGPAVTLTLVYKPDSALGEGTTVGLPLPQEGWENAKPENLTLSQDQLTLTYSCHFDEPLLGDGRSVLREAGTHQYSVDLTTGEATLTVTAD